MQRHDVESHLLALALGVELPQAPEGPVAGVVAQPGHEAPGLAQLAEQLLALGGVGQVGRPRVGAPELGGERLQPVAPAGDERDMVAAARQLARQLGADAGRRAGDDDRGVGVGCGEAHGLASCPTGCSAGWPSRDWSASTTASTPGCSCPATGASPTPG